MADDVARLVAVLEANIKSFDKNMAQAQRIADRRFGQIERRMNQADRRFAGFGKGITRAFAGALSIAGITRFVSAVGDMAGKIQDTSDALGVGTDFLQTWQAMALQAGVRTDQSNKALEVFAQRLGEAQLKGGPFAKFLNGIGVGTKGSVEQVLLRIADAVKNTASQEQRAAIVAEVFGAKQVKLTSFVQQGSAAIQKQGAELARTGGIMSREMIAKIDELGDKWEELKRRFTVLGGNVLGGFADEFSKFADELTDPQFQEGLKNLGIILADLAILVGKFGSGVGNLAGMFLPSGDEITQLRDLIKEWKSAGFAEGTVGAKELAAAETRLRALLRQSAERSGLGPDFSIPTGSPSGGIDRTGTLETQSGKTVAEREAELDIETANKVAKAVAEIREKRAEEDEQFRADRYNEAKELRDQNDREQLDALDQFHVDAKAAWDDYYERQAEATQQAADEAQRAHELLKEDIADSILFLGEAALQGGDSFERAIKGMIVQITLLALKMNVLKPLLDFAFGGSPGGGFLGGLLEGRASGGRVNPNQPYIVGERRPELFVPDTAGTIIPRLPAIASPQSAGMGGMVVNLSQTMTLAANGDAQLAQIAKQAAMDGAHLAVRTVQRNFPSMMVKAQRDRL